MWLLDVNMPRPLIAVLGELGIQSKTAIEQGWNELTNGRLVSAAVAQGFSCLLTRDQFFGESAARALKDFPNFSVVLVSLPQMKSPDFIQNFKAAWRTAPIIPVPGKIIHWPS